MAGDANQNGWKLAGCQYACVNVLKRPACRLYKLQAEFTAALWVDDTGCYPESLFNVGRETGLGWDAN